MSEAVSIEGGEIRSSRVQELQHTEKSDFSPVDSLTSKSVFDAG